MPRRCSGAHSWTVDPGGVGPHPGRGRRPRSPAAARCRRTRPAAPLTLARGCGRRTRPRSPRRGPSTRRTGPATPDNGMRPCGLQAGILTGHEPRRHRSRPASSTPRWPPATLPAKWRTSRPRGWWWWPGPHRRPGRRRRPHRRARAAARTRLGRPCRQHRCRRRSGRGPRLGSGRDQACWGLAARCRGAAARGHGPGHPGGALQPARAGREPASPRAESQCSGGPAARARPRAVKSHRLRCRTGPGWSR